MTRRVLARRLTVEAHGVRWWQVFVDKLSRRSRDDGVLGPRRRAEVRYLYQTSIEAKCSSWPSFDRLFTGDVSAHGMYVPTDHQAKVGEKIELKLTLPDGQVVPMTGQVVAVIDGEIAGRAGKQPGLGVRLDDFPPGLQKRFDELIAVARQQQVAPEENDFDIDVDSVPGDAEAGAEARIAAAPPAPPAPPAPGPGVSAKVAFAAVRPRRGRIIGIDLGTTYTSISAAVKNRVAILPFPDGERQAPSVIAFPQRGEIVVGAAARPRVASDPKHTIHSPKRLLGRKFDDRAIEAFLTQSAWTSERAPDDSVLIEMWGEKYAIPQLCAYILTEARDAAERALKSVVDRAVITVPVSFDEARVRLLRRAAQLARLEVVATIDEPSAAALANRFQPGFGGIVGVYDFGGGTFDFTVVDVSGGDFKVLATAGDSWLGGDDFDLALADAVANQIQKMHGIDLRKAVVDWQRVLYACERAKRQLTASTTAEIHVPELLRTATGTIDLAFRIDRHTLERVCAGVIDRSLATCSDALGLLDMKPQELSAIYLSGGTTYIPAVRSALQRHFAVPIKTGVPPEHAVCVGAGIHAAQLEIMGQTTLEEH
jgi:actin-like ATPase involved in cell morphogenesis/Tfp pilus assembly protein PilZ